MKAKVSVLLPVYNGEGTIKEAVESILHQSFTDFELLIIDDGSEDDTRQILNDINDDRIRIYQIKENGGIARALNFGLKLASAPIIARMDADDKSLPDRLLIQYEYLMKHPTCGVVSSLITHGGNSSQQGYAHYVNQINAIIRNEDIRNKRFQESPIAHPSVMFRSELIGKYGGYNEADLPEDYELWLRWMYHDVEIHKVNHNLLIWNDLPNRISRIYSNYTDDNFFRLKAKYLALHFKKLNGRLPVLWVWGTGRLVNRNSSYLMAEGFTIEKYIDIKPVHAPNHIYYKDIPLPGTVVIVSYVRDRKGKTEIAPYLTDRAYTEGVDFFLMT